MKKILQIGTKGQLGSELLRSCAAFGEIVGLDYPEVDLSDSSGLRRLVREVKPAIIINAGAYTNVDKAESEPELARAINAIGPAVLAEEAVKLNAVLVHYSSDYVFDGTKDSPYVETDDPNPINVYGQTKLEGERAIAASGCANLVLRTSWMYSKHAGFVAKVLEWSRANKVIRVVEDQISSPTPAGLVADITADLVSRMGKDAFSWAVKHGGVYHCVCAGYCSRYQWAKEVLRFHSNSRHSLDHQVLPALTADFPTPAQRPLRSCLDKSKLEAAFDLKLPDWLSALRLVVEA